MTVREFDKIAAQGDLLIRKIKSIPKTVKAVKPVGHRFVVAHSETGHHHYLGEDDVSIFEPEKDNFGMICYLQVDGDFADLVHDRSFDTHETIRIKKGAYEIRRQREYTPAGWRRVED